MDERCSVCGKPATKLHESGINNACYPLCDQHGCEACRPLNPAHPLDAAAAILCALNGAVMYTSTDGRVSINIGEDWHVAHLTDRALPLPSEALARRVKP